MNLAGIPRALIMLALFALALIVLGGVIARLGRNAAAATRSVV